MTVLTLHMRTQALAADERGRAVWQPRVEARAVPAEAAALIICDMWDAHWSRGAMERTAAMAPRVDEVVRAARRRGVHIIHAPSETLAFYAGSPARGRMAQHAGAGPAASEAQAGPALPIDDSDGGSDTGETPWRRAWTRQHPAIEIDEARDGISDDGAEICAYFAAHAIRQALILGVHTNMCILNRSFGIKALVRRGTPVALVRDLTDAMYNPARPPYVSHDEGTRLVVEYIEKFWCPTIVSRDLLGPRAADG
ncbi:MAG: Isochorismatase family protein [Chloroflexi bacterium ADurb.Bin325]|nr:MAG: Isochorismatase family protein [Chloroflexi bacterium ADurb.Bin325]